MDVVNPIDDKERDPGHGDQGSKLRYLLNRAGLKRKDVFLTYALRCKPWNAGAVKSTHLRACQEHLFREVLEEKPQVIVAMGNKPLESLLGEKSIKSFRGHFFDIEIMDSGKTFKTWVIPTYGLNGCLMNWVFDEQVIHDLKKAKAFVKNKKPPKKLKVDWEIATDLKSLQRLKKECLNSEFLTYDFETTGFKFYQDEIVMAGFRTRPGRAVIFPFYEYDLKLHGKKWDKENLLFGKKLNIFVGKHKEKIRETLKEIFQSNIPKDAWNGKFDVKFAKYNGFPVRRWVFDGIIAHALINENLRHDLTFNLEWYGINHLSDESGNYGPYDHDLWPFVNKEKKKPYSFAPPLILSSYLAKDVDGTGMLRPLLWKQIKKEKLITLFKKQQMPLVRLLSEFEYRGIKMDIDGFHRIAKKFTVILADLNKKMKKMVGNPAFNPNSPQQVLEYLEGIHTPLEKKTKGGEAFSTDKKVLEVLSKSRRKWGKFARLMIQFREITKLKGTYLDGKDGSSGMLSHISKRGKVHANYNAHTPRTGRLSSNDPNIQNIPRPSVKYPWANIRQLFIPSKSNWIIGSIDYKQIEMRIAAYLSKEMVMIREISEGVDLHTRNAVTFGKKMGLKEVPDDMTEYKFNEIRGYEKPENYDRLSDKKKARVHNRIHDAAVLDEFRVFIKSMGFGLNYGMEAITLAKDHDREVDEVQEMIDAYFIKYKYLSSWRQDQCDLWLDKGYLILPDTNRKRRFYGAADWFNSKYSQEIKKRPWDMAQVDRQAMNFPIQGYANEIFTQGKLRLCAAMKKERMKTHAILSNHDGLLTEGPLDEVNELKAMSKELMEVTLAPGKKHEVHLGIDFDCYDRWTGNKVKL